MNKSKKGISLIVLVVTIVVIIILVATVLYNITYGKYLVLQMNQYLKMT